MNNNNNTAFNVSPNAQQKGDVSVKCRYQCIYKVINSLSMLCSLMGISLFSALFFGWTNFPDYRSSQNIADYGYYLVVAAIILYCFAILLSLCKKDSEQTSPVALQTSVNGKPLVYNKYTADDSVESSKLKAHKLKAIKCENEVKQNALTESFKSQNSSAANVLDFNVLNQKGTCERTSKSKTEFNEKLSRVDMQLVPYVKKSESSLNKQIVPAVLSPPIQHRKNSFYEQIMPAVLSPRSQSHHQNSLQKQIVPTAISTRAANFFNTMPGASATEVISSRKMTFLPGGIAQCQEEYKIQRTTFFRCSENEISSPDMFSPKFYQNSSAHFRKLRQPHKNEVSDVFSKFEMLNF